MEANNLLNVLHTVAKLKDTTRHCYTPEGRHESVAEHCWRIALMTYLVSDEFPEADMNKVIKMCLIHDLGEVFTGDIPSFNKSVADEDTEERLLTNWVNTLPEPFRADMTALYTEMNALETLEAKIYKAMDKMEAVISHNESDIRTWEDHEYDLQKVYGWEQVEFSDYLSRLRQAILDETNVKIEREAP